MLDEVKEYIKIEDEDNLLKTLIRDGEGHLNSIVGIELDFENDICARSLLKDYCRYAYNNAKEYFDENFKDDLFRLQLKSAVKENAKQETSNK